MGIFDTDENGEYDLMQSTIEAFGNKIVHAKAGRDWTLIAHYDKSPTDGDGMPVNVYCVALPAEFYRIEALTSTNSCKQTHKGFNLSTGSGMAEQASMIAKSISEGMLGIWRKSDG